MQNRFDAQTYRKTDIENNLHKAELPVLDIMLTGVTGGGKSSTINALLGSEKAEVGHGVDPMTMGLDSYYLQRSFRVWDTPGLGDSSINDQIHEKKLIDLLYHTWKVGEKEVYGFMDMVVVVVEGLNRDLGTTIYLINNVILPCIEAKRVVIAINQADVAMKGREWDCLTNRPTPRLEEFLEQQAVSLQRRIYESCGIKVNKPVYFSAEHHYNLKELMNAIIEAMPEQRRNINVNN